MGQWSVDLANVQATPLPDGGLELVFTALEDGVLQGTVTAEMTGSRSWTVRWETAAGCEPLVGFYAWQV